MSKKPKTKERLKFDYDLYHKVAVVIHGAFCEDTQWCNYADPIPEELEDDESLQPWERQKLTELRIKWMQHCEAAVVAENIAAHIQFGKGAKVKKFPKPASEKGDQDDL